MQMVAADGESGLSLVQCTLPDGALSSAPLDAGYTIQAMAFDEGRDTLVAIVTNEVAASERSKSALTTYYVALVGCGGEGRQCQGAVRGQPSPANGTVTGESLHRGIIGEIHPHRVFCLSVCLSVFSRLLGDLRFPLPRIASDLKPCERCRDGKFHGLQAELQHLARGQCVGPDGRTGERHAEYHSAGDSSTGMPWVALTHMKVWTQFLLCMLVEMIGTALLRCCGR
jgi:hypothetical protein